MGYHFCRPDLFHRLDHLMVPMKRWTDSKENLQATSNLVAIITIQCIWPMIDGELRAESDIEAIAMRKIVHIAE